MLKNRLKSPIVWISILSQVCIIISVFSQTISEQTKIICTSIIEMLTLIGLLNNPTDKENF